MSTGAKQFRYSYSFGARVVDDYYKVHGRALSILHRLYRGSRSTVIYTFLTDAKRWRKLKDCIEIIEKNSNLDDRSLKYALQEYFRGGYYETNHTRSIPTTKKADPVARRRDARGVYKRS